MDGRMGGGLYKTIRRFFSKNLLKYKQSCTQLLKLSKKEARDIIATMETILCDADGVLWLYYGPISGSPRIFNCLRERGKKCYICTNNSTRSREAIFKKASQYGFQINIENILTSAHTLAHYLKDLKFCKTVYIIGKEGIAQELDAVDIKHTKTGPDILNCSLKEYIENIRLESDVGAVVVGFDDHISLPKLMKALHYLEKGEQCLFLATNTDETFPGTGVICPGSGVIVRSVEFGAKRTATIIGKPSAYLCSSLMKSGELQPETTLMIGDRGNTDILFGYNYGFHTVLVGSGIHGLDDVRKWRNSNDPELYKQVPDFYLPKFADLMQILYH